MSVAPGERIGAFEILQLLGEGGMGRVYRARDLKLGRDVAVKLLHERYRANRELLRRFEQEARAASGLNHPNIVTIHEIGEIEDGPFIVMELVPGSRLRDLLSTRPVTVKESVQIASGMADALAAAHGQGIVHRDLKPENVMLPEPGRVKILDFGLAKLMDVLPSESDDTLGRTDPGIVLGTPAYMSPEQASGRPTDHRSDQFALGSMLYEMLTGHTAFRRETQVETMAAIIREEPPPVSEANQRVPVELLRVLTRCLEKDPSQRYASTADLAHDLRSIVLDVSTAKATPVASRGIRLRRGRPGVFIAAAVLALIAAGGFWMFRTRTPAGPGPSPVVSRSGRLQLAVLPFTDVTGDPANQRIADGLSDMVAASLGGFHDLQVITPMAAGVAAHDAGLKNAVRDFGANSVLRGSFLRSNDRVRLTVQIVDVSNGMQLASESVDGATSDLFAVQDRITAQLARSLGLRSAELTHASDFLVTSTAQDRYFEALGLLQRYEDGTAIDEALTILQELRKQAADSALLNAALGRGYLYKYKLTREKPWAEKAEEYCREAVRLDPARAEVRITMGELYTRIGRFDEATGSFRRALELRPQSPEATLGMAEALDRKGESREAERLYREAIRLRPMFWGAYNKTGAFYMRRNRYGEASEMFAKVVSLAPDNVRGHSNFAAAQMMQGHFMEAVEPLRRSIAIRPNSDAYSNLGTCYYMLGRFDEAVGAFEEATRLTPANYILWYNLGDAYRWAPGDRKRADAAYARAIELAAGELSVNPNETACYTVSAAAHAKRGERAKAMKAIAKARQLAPEDAEVLFYSGMVAQIGGDREEAFRWLQRAVRAGFGSAVIERDPEFATLRKDPRFNQLKN